MSPSKILFFLCLAFILGIALESLTVISNALIGAFLVLGVAGVVASFLYKKEATVLAFCLLFFVMGILRLQTLELVAEQDVLRKLNDTPGKITLTGQIVAEPDLRISSQKLKVKIDDTQSVVLVTTQRYVEYHYLDKVQLEGKLKTPPEFDDFDYRQYLFKDGIYSIMDYPAITVMENERNVPIRSFLYSKILTVKDLLRESINRQFAPPESDIVKGILLGGTATMPEETKEKFSATGLTHLTAISGSNIVILSSILISFLLFFGLWRHQALYFTMIFIWAYIIIAGFPASGIRAAVMASVFLLAQTFGRQNTNARVIVLAAALMLLKNPLLLFNDVGFQLSFLASMGIIYIKPLFDHFFSFITHEKIKFLIGIISVTLAAQIATLPVLVFYFKNISIVSLITNILIIPIVDWVMIFGFLSAFFGIFSGVLGFIFSLPASVLLSYFMAVVNVFAQPWAVITIEAVPMIWIAVYYAILVFGVWWLQKKNTPQFLG